MDPSCYRFYPQSLPSEGDLVMVRVTSVTSLGVYVVLLEYGQTEAMISQSELTRRRIRSVTQLVKIGQILCCLVVRVDEKKGYIDLSKRRVSEEEAHQCVTKYSRAKTVHSIIIRTADLLDYSNDTEVYDFYSKTAWHLNSVAKKGRKGQAYDVFCSALHDPEVLSTCNIKEEAKAVLLTTIQARLQDCRVHVKACISVVCYGPDGVGGVKESLREGLKHSTKDVPVKIRYFKAPHYSVTAENVPVQTKAAALNAVTSVMSSVEQRIRQFQGGDFSVVDEPKIFSAKSHSAGDDESNDSFHDDDDDDDDDLEDLDYCSGSDNNDVDDDVDSGAEHDDGNDDSRTKNEELLGACGGFGGEDSGIGNDVL